MHAITLFSQSLPAASLSQGDQGAVNLNQQAVWLACCGLGTVPHGASHGIGYILGAMCAIPHGYTSCVMLPAVLEWNATVLGDKSRAITDAMGQGSQDAHVVVKTLISELGLPTSLRQLDVPRHLLQQIAARAYAHPVVRKNPRPIVNAGDVSAILEIAW